MARSINLLFGVHNHQPVGNFEHVFKKATQDCYRPFVNTLYNYPEIKTTLHFSGSLVDWLLENDASLLQKVKQMVKRHQVEILTGGYYEPILSIIPERDRIGQIEMLSNFIKNYFEYEPEGAWIGERVWHPQLVKTLVQVGVKYILLDDFHFYCAGIKEGNLLGYYLTGEEGQTLAVFPISKKLRYVIPFSQPAQPLTYLKTLASEEGKAVAIIVDDGEKFGLWPGTHKWVYHEKWLEKFFQLLIRNQNWIKTQTISEYMRRYKPLGLCRIPHTSYEEMMSWSGNSFTNFFFKYPEANNLHKRMLYVSERLNKVEDENKEASGATRLTLREAKRHLYMGQCNCPYWHGVFGGIYLGHLRHIVYKNLIYAQSLVEKKGKSRWIKSEVLDFDRDGMDELIIKNPFLNVFVTPRRGGAIFEFDYMPKCVNLMDVMTRRPESYHERIKLGLKRPFQLRKKKVTNIHDLLGNKEKGLENFLIFDSYRRLSLLDHFLSASLVFKDFKDACYEELGDFINAQYSVKQKKARQRITIILQKEGKIIYQDKKVPLRINKNLSLNDRDRQISIEYNLENLSGIPLDITFAVEFNISPSSQEHPNSLHCNEKSGPAVYSLKEDVDTQGIRDLRLQDVNGDIESIFYFDKEPSLWAYPLETISASEQGFERNYQQTVILPHWQIRLEETWQTQITLAIAQT